MSRACSGFGSHPITLILGPEGVWLDELGNSCPKNQPEAGTLYPVYEKPPEVWGFRDPSLVSLPGQSGRLEIPGPFPATRPSSKLLP